MVLTIEPPVLLYSDISCLEGATEAPLAVCENATVVQAGNAFPTWNSYYYKCDS